MILAVADSGPGLSPTDRQFAFDPFYSGRQAGRGLGMGLPVAANIAHAHGGTITLGTSRPTTVTVTLGGLEVEPALAQAG